MNEGTLRDRYEIYRSCADDGDGNDITTGEPLLTFEEWLNNETGERDEGRDHH